MVLLKFSIWERKRILVLCMKTASELKQHLKTDHTETSELNWEVQALILCYHKHPLSSRILQTITAESECICRGKKDYCFSQMKKWKINDLSINYLNSSTIKAGSTIFWWNTTSLFFFFSHQLPILFSEINSFAWKLSYKRAWFLFSLYFWVAIPLWVSIIRIHFQPHG